MAGVTDDRIGEARDLLAAARTEFDQAQQAIGGSAIIALRNSCGKGWLAVLEAANALFVKRGVAVQELPSSERGRRSFAQLYMQREMRRTYNDLWKTFHIDGYYEGIVEFDDMPGYFEELEEFIDQAEVAESTDGVEG